MYVRTARNVVSRAHLADERASDVELLPTGFGTRPTSIARRSSFAGRSVRPETRARSACTFHKPSRSTAAFRRVCVGARTYLERGSASTGDIVECTRCCNRKGQRCFRARRSSPLPAATFFRQFSTPLVASPTVVPIATPACSSPYRCRTTDALAGGVPRHSRLAALDG